MKNKLSGVALAACMTLFVCFPLNGCAKATEYTAVQTTNPIVLLNGYEDQGDLNSLLTYEYLGKVELNEDKNYVKSGEKSGKITVMKDRFDGRNKTIKPYLFQSSRNVSKSVIENDFKYTVGLGYNIYNAQDEERTIGVRLVYSRNYNMVANYEETVEFTLAPNSWNEIFLNVIREKIALNTPRYGDNSQINLVVGFDTLFITPDSDCPDDVYYIDDVRLYKTTEGVAAKEETSLRKDEICSFDSEWQVNKLDYSNHISYFTGVEWSKAFSTDGGASLKILTGDLTYMQIIKSTYCPQLELSDYNESDSLNMEFYSPNENGYSGSVTIWLISSTNEIFYKKSYILSPGNIVYVSIPIAEINGNELADAENGLSFEFLKTIQISVGKTSVANVLYLDNVRMERGA